MKILDHIPVRLDFEEILKRLHVDKNSDDSDAVQKLIESIQHVINPKAVYEASYVEHKDENTLNISGIRFTSSILKANLDGIERVFPYIATCGKELDEIEIPPDDFLKQFWLDTIKEMALRDSIKHLRDHLKKEYALGQISSMNPGSLEDWPITQQVQLFSIFGNPEDLIGVRLTDSFLMVPTKSVSGIHFPTEVKFESCQLCPRKECPSRKAPYDKELAKNYEKPNVCKLL